MSVAKVAQPRVQTRTSLSLLRRRDESVVEVMRLVLALKAELTRLDLLAELSEDTKEEFGAGLDHVRCGFTELEDGVLGLLRGA